MFRNQFAQFYINCTRSFSSASLELSEAWKQLREKTIKFQPTALQQRTIENERRWALNLNVELSSCKNRYESEIMALYYTMIYAHHKQIFYVSLYTYNEIVAKVASGQYNAHKFKNLYDKILRRMTDDNDILRARITYLDANLIKSKSIVEPEKQMDTYQFLSEDDFLDKMGGSVGVI